MNLSVVTAMLDPVRSRGYWTTWRKNAIQGFQAFVALTGQADTGWYPDTVGIVTELAGLVQRQDVVTSNAGFGVVPYFEAGTKRARESETDIIACLHDDVAICEPGWDVKVKRFFYDRPDCVLLGFGGATGLGADDIYKSPYDPMQLARQSFWSNMKEAEAHGKRATWPLQVACLDGFSLIGRADFMLRAWKEIAALGVRHHAYDGMFGVIAKREGGEVWMLPLACHHHGGLTAVGDPRYAREVDDKAEWKKAHRAFYEIGRRILPIRI